MFLRPFDENGNCRPVELAGGLRRRAVRGAGATITAQAAGFVIQMGSTVVLARLLTPSDFGLVAMVSTFSLLLMNCGLNGFTEAIVQRSEMDRSLISNVFWINVSVGLVLTAIFASAGELLANFYHDSRVAGVAVAMSLSILITTLSVQHLALLKRAMRFSAVSMNDVIARLVSVSTSIVLAVLGWHYWALVGGALALPLATCIGAWVLCRWRPRFPRTHEGTRPVVWFALGTYGRFTTNYLTNNLDNLLVGWWLGPVPLGFYKKAYDLFVMPPNQLSAPLTSVAVSTLSRLDKNSEQFKRYFLTAFSVLAFIGMGIGGDLTLVGRDVIRILLGPAWSESGRIFTFFGPGIGIMLLYFTNGWLHLAIGRADRWFRWGLIECSVTAALFIGGLRWGAAGVACAWVASYWILTLPALWYAGRPIKLGIADIISCSWRYILSSLLASYATLLTTERALIVGTDGILHSGIRICVFSTVFGLFYIGSVLMLHRSLEPVRMVLGVVTDLLPGGIVKTFFLKEQRA